MKTVNIHEAKTHLSRLVEAAAAGEEIIIAKSGRPMAKLIALEAPEQPRRPGALRGRIRMHEDFDAPLPPEIARGFGAGGFDEDR